MGDDTQVILKATCTARPKNKMPVQGLIVFGFLVCVAAVVLGAMIVTAANEGELEAEVDIVGIGRGAARVKFKKRQ